MIVICISYFHFVSCASVTHLIVFSLWDAERGLFGLTIQCHYYSWDSRVVRLSFMWLRPRVATLPLKKVGLVCQLELAIWRTLCFFIELCVLYIYCIIKLLYCIMRYCGYTYSLGLNLLDSGIWAQNILVIWYWFVHDSP